MQAKSFIGYFLETSLQRSGLSERELEERLGWEPGELGRMLDGAADCDPLQLLALLSELGLKSAEAPPPLQHLERGTQMVQELIERFRGLGYGLSRVDAADVPCPVDEIEKTVEDVLQRTFGKFREGRAGRR